MNRSLFHLGRRVCFSQQARAICVGSGRGRVGGFSIARNVSHLVGARAPVTLAATKHRFYSEKSLMDDDDDVMKQQRDIDDDVDDFDEHDESIGGRHTPLSHAPPDSLTEQHSHDNNDEGVSLKLQNCEDMTSLTLLVDRLCHHLKADDFDRRNSSVLHDFRNVLKRAAVIIDHQYDRYRFYDDFNNLCTFCLPFFFCFVR
jgi:hypothetical protein